MRRSREDLCFTPALQLRQMLQAKAISPVELVTAYLDRIQEIDPHIHAYVAVVPESAIAEAKKAESEILRGDAVGLLAGLPVAVKDNTLTAGIRTTYGSLLFKDFVPSIDELVVERLHSQGAIIIGKTNVPEFAAGAHTVNRVFPVTRNPWDMNFTVGGSTGGGAAAVAAGMTPLAQGNDLYGSLRIPASFCGVVGLRPSPGRIPWYPNELHFDDMPVQGPITRTVGDAALMLDAMCGPDHRSPLSYPKEQTPFLNSVKHPRATRKMKIAWSGDLNFVPVEKEVTRAFQTAIGVFSDLGCEIVEDCPDLSGMREVAQVLRAVRFASLYYDQIDDARFRELVNPNVIGNVEQGLQLSMRTVAKAQRRRSDLWEGARKFFDNYDFLVTPTSPVTPYGAETQFPTEIDGEPMQNYVDWAMFTYTFTMFGLPAISVPCGRSGRGLPIGLQIVGGRRYAEAGLLEVAAAYESAAPWLSRRPEVG